MSHNIKRHVAFSMVAFAAILFNSCSDEFVKGIYIASNNEYSLNIQASSLLDIPAEGGVVDTRINASTVVEWSIQDLPQWMTTSTASGYGSQDIKFNVQPNESFSSSRTHIFNIVTTNSDWGMIMPISVTQLKKDKKISLSPTDNSSWTFDSDGGHKELNIFSNVNWTVECKESFVSLSKVSGNGDGNMIITVTPYKSIDVIENRTANLFFKESSSDEVLQVLTITQTPLQTTVSTESINVEFDKNRNTRTFTLGAVSGGYSVTSDATWLSISKNKDNEVDVTLSCDVNENDDERTTNAYVFLENTNTIKYTFRVKQQGNIIVITPSTLSFDANGGTQTVNVESSTSWKTINLNDWLSVQENGSICTVLAKDNSTLDARVGEILFNRISPNGDVIGKTVKLHITQEGRKILPDTQTLRFGPEMSSQTLNIESDAQWTLYTNEDWISLSSTEGYGNKSVSISATDNTTTSIRNGRINLNCLGRTIVIEVIQESAYLNTTSTAIELDAVGGSAIITLATNMTWSATTTEPWLQLSQESGIGESQITLSAGPNQTLTNRTSVVTISTKLGVIKINVRQAARSIWVSQNYVTFDYGGGKSSPIIIVADGEYNINVVEQWVSFIQSNNTITISASVNDGKRRTSQITLSLKDANVSTVINVVQKEAPDPLVILYNVSSVNWAVALEASVEPNGHTIESVGFIWRETNDPSRVQAPTLDSNDGIVHSTLDGYHFKGYTPQMIGGRYACVRAYIIDSHGNVYYSDCMTVKL